jgi:hypothetical protein
MGDGQTEVVLLWETRAMSEQNLLVSAGSVPATVLGQKSVSPSLTRGATSIVLPTSTHYNYVKSTPNLTRGGPKCSQKAQYDIARKK